uniref:Uncharacterized protein n=1 Tax=Rhizophora mucronata TaxID=61149 RepID=A0A2P2LYL2_RHIMU
MLVMPNCFFHLAAYCLPSSISGI